MAWISVVGAQKYLTQAQKENNATEVYNFFYPDGMTLEAICGLLGNMTRESSINPGMKQTESESSGWGLIQWTPSTRLTEWCNTYGYTWHDGNAQCIRIKAEGEKTMGASGYWLPTSAYPYSWSEFKALTDVAEATKAYMYERERPGEPALELRMQYAAEWYEFFTGSQPPEPPEPPEPPGPSTPTGERKKMPLWMMIKPR